MPARDPDADLQHTTDEMADRLNTLGGHLDEATEKAEDLAREKTPDALDGGPASSDS